MQLSLMSPWQSIPHQNSSSVISFWGQELSCLLSW